ncbi:MAG: TMEM175 family protein [Pseudomonadota bacterium]
MWTEEKLAELPQINGFRQRGMDMTRLETFTDAAFAFALTLLVISFDNIPTSIAELNAALKNIPAFAASFLLIAMFWYAHHKWSRRFGLDDVITVVLSLIFVFVTLVFVFPLRLMASAFLSWITQGWVPFELDEASGNVVAYVFVVYGAGFVCMSTMICLLYVHALRVKALNLNSLERFIAKAELQAWLILLSSGVLSTLIATLAPPQYRAWAGLAYAPLGIIMPIWGYWKSRQEAAA